MLLRRAFRSILLLIPFITPIFSFLHTPVDGVKSTTNIEGYSSGDEAGLLNR